MSSIGPPGLVGRGVTWTVWAVVPEKRSHSTLRGPFSKGWLTFETEDERRHRKRSTTRGGMTEDEAKRLRHERRSVRNTRPRVGPMLPGGRSSAWEMSA